MYFASGRLSLKHLKWAILAAPTLLLGISYASLQWGQWYVDLASAASQAFVFFGLIGTARSQRQNYWGNPANLGTEGWSQAFALRTIHGTTATKLFDSLAPLQVPMCLQALTWQRSSVLSETELWVLRISAASAEELGILSNRIDKYLSSAPWLAVSPTATEPAAYLSEQVPLGQALRNLFAKTHTEHPFIESDRALIQNHKNSAI
jgi:hypothetical protein